MEKLQSGNHSDETHYVIADYIKLLGYNIKYMNMEERNEN